MLSNFMEPKKRGRKPKKEDDSSLGLSSSILTNPILKTLPLPFALPPALLNLSVQAPLASLASLSPVIVPGSPRAPLARTKSTNGFPLPSPLPIPSSPPTPLATLSSPLFSSFPLKPTPPVSPPAVTTPKAGVKRTLSEQGSEIKRVKSETGEKRVSSSKEDSSDELLLIKGSEEPLARQPTQGTEQGSIDPAIPTEPLLSVPQKVKRSESDLDNPLESSENPAPPEDSIPDGSPTDLGLDISGDLQPTGEELSPQDPDSRRLKRKEKNKIAARKCRAKKQVEVGTLHFQVKIQAEEIQRLFLEKVEVVEIMQNLIRLGILDGTNQFQDLSDEEKELSRGLLKRAEEFIQRTAQYVQQRQIQIQQYQRQMSQSGEEELEEYREFSKD